MLPRPRGIPLPRISRAAWLVGIVLFFTPANLLAEQTQFNVVCREDLLPVHREQLAAKLRKITGWPDLKFSNDGRLLQGIRAPLGGSESARQLVANAISGRNVVVIEDATNRTDVVFCRVNSGRWKKNARNNPPAFVVQLDFADFEQLVGDERALEAFNVGWGLLHELDHIVNDSPDATALGEAGECEAHINQMRFECNLPQRTDYFYTLLPLSADSAFATRIVRLAFEQRQPQTKKKKRYWVIWDANVVGGLEQQNQVAALK